MNIKLAIAYDGTDYLGWQKTRMGPSIEEEILKVLKRILQEEVVLQAASRTDRGVHALGQVANFHVQNPISDFSKLMIGMNALLPPDIVIREAEEVPAEFHATLATKGKVYSYEICYGKVQLPRDRHFSWHVHTPIQLDLMKEAAKLLVGTHDFTSFCNQKKNEKYLTHERTVDKILIEELPDERIKITVEGPNFLYKMVRNLVGTLFYVGCGKIPLQDVKEILEKKNRVFAGMTAPAHGLTLVKVLL